MAIPHVCPLVTSALLLSSGHTQVDDPCVFFRSKHPTPIALLSTHTSHIAGAEVLALFQFFSTLGPFLHFIP